MTRFVLTTGLRRANVTGLQWKNVDIGRKVARVWEEDAKGKKHIHVPLNSDAIAEKGEQFWVHFTDCDTLGHRGTSWKEHLYPYCSGLEDGDHWTWCNATPTSHRNTQLSTQKTPRETEHKKEYSFMRLPSKSTATY